MLVNFIKFFHVLFALGLLGSTLFCVLSAHNAEIKISFSRKMLFVSFLAVLTGTFLVHPAHFTFHTPWIIAAYLLVAICAFSLFLMIRYKKTSRLTYLGLFVLLLCVVHDAVTKSTFLLY